jgi:hypothetical protein
MNKDPVLRWARRIITPGFAAFLSGGALFLAGCGDSDQTQTNRSFAFDSLGSELSKGGSSIIRVYAGVKNTPKDEVTTGTFANKQTAEADCMASGQHVASVPSEGEAPRSSNEWLQIDNPSSSQPMYATVVYTRPSEEHALSTLPKCVNPQ